MNVCINEVSGGQNVQQKITTTIKYTNNHFFATKYI